MNFLIIRVTRGTGLYGYSIFLIGLDKGMEWKIASGLSESPVALVINKENIKSIKDFSEKDRIALPQPGIALLHLIILWFGAGEIAIIFIIVHSVVWPLVLNLLTGFKSIPKIYKQVGNSYGLNSFKLIMIYLSQEKMISSKFFICMNKSIN